MKQHGGEFQSATSICRERKCPWPLYLKVLEPNTLSFTTDFHSWAPSRQRHLGSCLSDRVSLGKHHTWGKLLSDSNSFRQSLESCLKVCSRSQVIYSQESRGELLGSGHVVFSKCPQLYNSPVWKWWTTWNVWYGLINGLSDAPFKRDSVCARVCLTNNESVSTFIIQHVRKLSE